MHRDQFKDAEDLVDSAHILLGELGDALAEHSDLFHSGFVYDAQKEYTEAKITLALLSHQQIPNPNELGVSYPAYLNGLAEAASELRRYLLDSLRKGKDENCEQLFEMMDDIYSLLVTIDFPDSLTGGLRRSTDVLRGVMEKTRGDLTLFLKQGELATKIDRCFQREKGGKFNGSHKG
jgi:translin